MRFFEVLEQIIRRQPGASVHKDSKDEGFGTRATAKEIDRLPPERAAELAGHAPERVDT